MSPIQMERCSIERLDFGKMGYGCKHYRRRCRIRAPCCNEIYPCRRCHNEATVVCLVCDTEQPASRVCTNCGVRIGEYFCEICKFYDDDINQLINPCFHSSQTDKGLFPCDDCGICRVGGRDQFFHCKKCGSDYKSTTLSIYDLDIGMMSPAIWLVFGRIIHASRILRHHCSICYEFLFDSMKHTTGMKCGHTMHTECYYEMLKHDVYCCPICSKSVIYMLRNWKRIDEEIKATITFRNYRRKVWIVCRDCNGTTDVYFNMVGQKCSHYKSCNTSSIAPPPVLSQ